MMVRSLPLVLAVLLVLPLHAQQAQGDIELQLQGSYFTMVGTDVSVDVGTIAGKFAPFITDALQIGLGPTLTIQTTTTTDVAPGTGQTRTRSSTRVTFGSTAFIAYSILLKDARTVPYVQAQFYKRDFSNRSERGWVGAGGGMKYFFTRRTSLDVSANYLRSLNSGSQGGMVLFMFGLSFLV